MSLPRFEPGPSSIALQCANHYTNRAMTIVLYKLRYINITSSIQHQNYFSKKATLSKTKTINMKVLSKSIPVKRKLAYLQCNILNVMAVQYYFLQDIWLFDLTFLKFMTMRKTQTKNIHVAETCFDTVKHFGHSFIFTLKKGRQCQS